MNTAKLLLTALFSISLFGCSSSSTIDAPNENASGSTSASGGQITIEFPEGDASVSAEDGGPGFTGEGWATSSPGRIGSPNAVRGGLISTVIPSWPENLRRFGTGSNTWLNYSLADLCYEALCGTNPITLETTPSLATHWQISDDQMTFRFRINPEAYWSDGKPVVADDGVVSNVIGFVPQRAS